MSGPRPTKRVFVTGATGEVGRHVVPELLMRGYGVTGVGRSEAKRAELVALGADAVALDMFDGAAARRALDGHDVVINLATHMPSSTVRMLLPWEWSENDHVRREGSATLANAALAVGVKRFIQESFAPIYEDGGGEWIDERWPVRPVRYNRTILDAERSAVGVSAAGGAGVVLRFASFYGPDLMMREMIGVIRRGWSPLPGQGDAYWSSVHHEDAASAVVAALGVPAGIYNVCDDEPLRRGDWAAALAAAVGARKPRLMPPWLTRLGGSSMELLSRSQRMSNATLKRASSWTPKRANAREGLLEVVRALGRT